MTHLDALTSLRIPKSHPWRCFWRYCDPYDSWGCAMYVLYALFVVTVHDSSRELVVRSLWVVIVPTEIQHVDAIHLWQYWHFHLREEVGYKSETWAPVVVQLTQLTPPMWVNRNGLVCPYLVSWWERDYLCQMRPKRTGNILQTKERSHSVESVGNQKFHIPLILKYSALPCPVRVKCPI